MAKMRKFLLVFFVRVIKFDSHGAESVMAQGIRQLDHRTSQFRAQVRIQATPLQPLRPPFFPYTFHSPQPSTHVCSLNSIEFASGRLREGCLYPHTNNFSARGVEILQSDLSRHLFQSHVYPQPHNTSEIGNCQPQSSNK